jgi:hypothetical protein
MPRTRLEHQRRARIGRIAAGNLEITNDVQIPKRQGVVNARDDPNFNKTVADTGRKQLIIAAVTTDICLVFPYVAARPTIQQLTHV